MIPKVIHYCWFGGKSQPWDVKRCIKSWKKYCPDYEIKQWDESNFDVNCQPFIKSAYVAKKWAFVADYARLKIILENGGIYLDTDVELLRNLDLLLENECYMGIAQNGNINSGLGFGSIKGHRMVKEMLCQYDDMVFDEKKPITCPMLNTELFVKYGYKYEYEEQTVNGVYLYPPKFFDPFAPGDGNNLLCEETFSIHHYSASWLGGWARFKRKIIMLIGVGNIEKIKSFTHK